MPVTKERLIRDYTSAMHEGDAALFIGAGLSRPSGMVDWKGLLRECAQELGLDIDRESDLVAVAQYHLNKSNHDRSRLDQIMRREFDRRGTASRNHEIIARLPISTVWTTNFDSLIESHYEKAGKIADVKSEDVQIGTTKPKRDVTVYKMHGDIAKPSEIIISKDDYERYAIKHSIFQNALEGDLLQKNFLFLGFSFADPHLEYMLGHLRALLKDSKREHFAVMRRESRGDYSKTPKGLREFKYAVNRQELRIDDLQRYSIKTLLVDEFDEIPQLLEAIENHFYFRNVFVSGSADVFDDAFPEERIRELAYKLGRRLMEEGYNLISGFGVNIGSPVIMGALERLYKDRRPSVEHRLWLRPFPQRIPAPKWPSFAEQYRRDMLSKCGFAIFIAGNKKGEQAATGVIQEYEIARELNKLPIPLGATGFAAQKIWKKVEANRERIYGRAVSQQLFQRLNNPRLSNAELIETVFKVIRNFTE